MMVVQELLQTLYTIIDPARLDTTPHTLALCARDAMHPQRLPAETQAVRPFCVARPQSTEEVAALVRCATTHNIPIIPMGGGSGLMGGAATVVPGIVLDLQGLQSVHIRPEDRMAEVGAGVTLEALNHAAAPYNLMCAHDPWTVAVATVGGTISTNSLGYLGGKYGAMGDQVLAVEVVLPTGAMCRTRAAEKTSTGPALPRLFVGAEGCFGIITQATLRLFPVPQARLLEAWEFPDFASGFAAIQALLQAGLRPGLMEYNDDQPSLTSSSPTILYVSYEGRRRVAEAEAAEAAQIYQELQGRRLPAQVVEDFWEHRHDRGHAYATARKAGETWPPRHPPIDYIHVALPPSAVLAYRRRSMELLESLHLRAQQTGLWAHAGLFSLVYSGGEITALAEAHYHLLQLCQDMAGAMEYCHGVGTRLAPLMAREHGSGLQVLQRLKQSLDPANLLNPGKLALFPESPGHS